MTKEPFLYAKSKRVHKLFLWKKEVNSEPSPIISLAMLSTAIEMKAIRTNHQESHGQE
jgi:hypothetical protein